MLKAQEGRIPKEEEIYNLQIGLGESALIHEEKHFFDIAGYRVVEDLLTDEQVTDARQSVMNMEKTPPRHARADVSTSQRHRRRRRGRRRHGPACGD